jgi:uncharacterized membrane protein YqjE
MTMDALSLEIEEAGRRVRSVQRKRMLVASISMLVAALFIVPGEALIVWALGNTSQGNVNVMVFALPFALGLPAAWAIRTAMWPKDPVI